MMDAPEFFKCKFIIGGEQTHADFSWGQFLISFGFLLGGIVFLILAFKKMIIYFRIKKHGVRTKATSTYNKDNQTILYDYCANEEHYVVKRHMMDNRNNPIGRVTIYYDKKKPNNFITDYDRKPWISIVVAFIVIVIGAFGLLREIEHFI